MYNLTLAKRSNFHSKLFYLVRKTYEKVSDELEKVEPNKKIGDPINYGSAGNVNSIMSGRQDSNLRPHAP